MNKPISATKYLSLDTLYAIRDNYYRHPESLQEYHAETVDFQIAEKENVLIDECPYNNLTPTQKQKLKNTK